MGPCLLPLDWISLAGLLHSPPERRQRTLMGTPGVDLSAHVGVAFASYFYCHLFNQGQPHRSLALVSQIQEEKFYGFHSHQSESSQGTYPPGRLHSGLSISCFPLGSDRHSWKLKCTAPFSPLNSSFLGLACVISPPNFIPIFSS